MGEVRYRLQPGNTQVERIKSIRKAAASLGDDVRQYPRDGEPGWLTIVIKGPRNRPGMTADYDALEYLGLLGPTRE